MNQSEPRSGLLHHNEPNSLGMLGSVRYGMVNIKLSTTVWILKTGFAKDM